ncbi:hypothetical protein ACYULU_11195 [Breznakiellaceae bacterium SP9]
MQYMTAESAQKGLDSIIDHVTRFNEPVTIVSNTNKATVLLSMEEWRGDSRDALPTINPRNGRIHQRGGS